MVDNTDRDIKYLKIVYFDEEAATDLIYMKNKGKIFESITENGTTGKEIKGKAGAEIEGKNGLLSLFGLKFGIGGNTSIAYGAESLMNQVITNTVLTDYLNLSETIDRIIKFRKGTIKPYPESLSHYKIVTPYLIMTEGKLEIGNIKLNVSLIDEAIKNAKGYYELIFTDLKNKNSVLRFNLKSFKNSYSLSDLVKMRLTYHAVCVGSCKLSELDIKKEFSYEEEFVDGTLLADFCNSDVKDEVYVYDVILAGVEYD